MRTVLINGESTDIPDNIQTGADLKKFLRVNREKYVVTVTFPNDYEQQLLDDQVIPRSKIEISIFPAGRFCTLFLDAISKYLVSQRKQD